MLAPTAAQSPATLPGVLRGTVTLTLETHPAQRLVKGRSGTADRPEIIGLVGFARRLRRIWQGARVDDPYGHWWLLKVQAALDKAETELRQTRERIDTLLTTIEAIHAPSGTSVRPVRTPLRFGNPYAYRGALLLGQYDGLVRAALTAQHIGLMTRNGRDRVVYWGGRHLRRVFSSPLGYRLTGLTRSDVLRGSTRSMQAQQCMGQVPEEVLHGTVRARHTPIRTRSASSAPALSIPFPIGNHERTSEHDGHPR